MTAIKETNFKFKGQTGFYRGKVRDVYYFGDRMVMVATDRISAFDVVLPRAIPDKGRVLNQIAALNLESTKSLVPNWVQAVPDPNVTVGFRRERPFPQERCRSENQQSHLDQGRPAPSSARGSLWTPGLGPQFG